MQQYYKDGCVFISDYEKELFGKLDHYDVALPEEKERLRDIYEEITGEAVYSKRIKSVRGEGTAYYYQTLEKWEEMRILHYPWWSDVLSATVGND